MLTLIVRNVHETDIQRFQIIGLQQPIAKYSNEAFQVVITPVYKSVANSHKCYHTFVPFEIMQQAAGTSV